MKNKTILEPNRNWQAESDARTLMEHQKIMSDPLRHKAAIGEAKKMMQERIDDAKACKKIANQKPKGVKK